ncbi:MAG: hypothetical protein HY017_10535 [Betaproteobacteria bacterium]|nr:hypothetical protein [Betaproteobacteria bacterium]
MSTTDAKREPGSAFIFHIPEPGTGGSIRREQRRIVVKQGALKSYPSAAEIRRQCRLANAADKRDDWRAFIVLPG